ncbi:MAG: NUDIX hydrolase [Clostridia bacterium]
MNLRKEIEAYIPFDETEEADKRVILTFMDHFQDVLTRNNEIGHFTTSAFIVNHQRTKVLMIYHNIYQSWAWVGGHADGEENLEEVIKKEIAEETGIEHIKFLKEGIFAIEDLIVTPHYKRGKFVPAHLHFDVTYLVEADEKEMIRMKKDENSGVKWIPIEKVVESSTEEHMKPIYQKLMDKLEAIEKS